MFGVGHYNVFLKNNQLIYCFGKVWVVLRRTYEAAVVLKRTFYSSGPKKDRL